MQAFLFVYLIFLTFFVYGEESTKFESFPSSSLASSAGLLKTIINESVSAISGEYSENEVDLILQGPEPLILQRSYSNHDNSRAFLYDAWQLNHPATLIIHREDGGHAGQIKKRYEATLTEQSGGNLLYSSNKSHKERYPLHFVKAKGLTNCGGEEISSRTNIKNQTCLLEEKLRDIHLYGPAGDMRLFVKTKDLGNEGVIFHPKKHTKANGQQLTYEYERTKHKDKHLTRMSACDQTEKVKYSSLDFDFQTDKHFKDNPIIHVKASDGRSVDYQFRSYQKGRNSDQHFYLSNVRRPNYPDVSYQYVPKHGKEYLQVHRKEWPESRFLETSYYSSGPNEVDALRIEHVPLNDERINRVKIQREPVGIDSTPICTYRFIYEIGKKTNVYDAYCHLVSYHYNQDQRVVGIEKFTGSAHDPVKLRSYSWEGYIWGENGSQDETNLLGKYLKDSSGNIVSARFFQYDKVGNVIADRTYGSLSGEEATPISLKDNKIIENGCESYGRTCRYTEGAYRLIYWDREDNGRTLMYSYKPQTDLITSRVLNDGLRNKLRQFYEYNELGVLVKVIMDDGTGGDRTDLTNITESRIAHIYPRLTVPIGLPEKVDINYEDPKTGDEGLISRVTSQYSNEGHLLQEDHYGSEEDFQFSLFWEYDAHGNITKETNALGQSIIRQYDANDNLIYEQGPSLRHYTLYSYDFSNRLIKEEHVHDDGERLVTSHRYDYLSNRIATIDPFGHETNYEYDEFSRLIRTIGPWVANENGVLIRPVTETSYDVHGNPILVKDAKENTTQTTFNAYGKPTVIIHPDQTVERNFYYLDGNLKKSVAPNGTITCYTYDYRDRVIAKEVYSPDQRLLNRSSSVYNAFHVLSTTDEEGYKIHYEYDKMGRLICTQSDQRKLQFVYDTLGRVSKKIAWCNANDAIVTAYAYDLLDRVIEERVENLQGNLLSCTRSCFDEEGNCTHKSIETQAGTSTTITEYNSRKQPVKIIDAMGNVTIISYKYRFLNVHQQEVLQTESCDPLGNITQTTFDPLGRSVSIVKKDAMGQIMAVQDVFYDLLGKQCKMLQHVLLNGKPQRQIATIWKYNTKGQVTHLSEAVGSPEQKDTTYVYNSYGEKTALIKPDGNQVSYEYDHEGHLLRFWSKDFDYRYTYDRKHQPVQIEDVISKTKTVRGYDASGAIISETLANGCTLASQVDMLGRTTQLTLPDQSAIEYVYQSMHLKEVNRVKNGKILYSHHYEYDLSHAVIDMKLPEAAGHVKYTYDLLSRPVNIEANKRQQKLIKYDSVGNLVGYQFKDSIGKNNSRFSYDNLYQLRSEEGTVSHTYQCDSIHNRVSKDKRPYQLNALNQLLQETNCQYTYDRNGNLTQKAQAGKTIHYQYDALDRLVAVDDGQSKTTYTYDAFNRRLSKNGNIHYIYANQDEIGAIENGALIELRVLGKGKGAEIGAAVALEIHGKRYVPLHDHNGNIVTLLSHAGQVVETYRYSAFGEEIIFDANGQKVTNSCNPWRYASKRYDSETGFLYFGRRYYAPDIGRWVTPDPLGFDAGPNLYAYVHHSPLLLIDLYGLRAEKDDYVERRSLHYRHHSRNFRSNASRGPINDHGIFENIFSTTSDSIWIKRVCFGTNGRSRLYTVGDEPMTEKVICFGNGIKNTMQSARSSALILSRFAGGKQILSVYNPSRGLIVDTGECFINAIGIATDPVRKYHEMWDKTWAMDPQARILQTYHSQGAFHVCHALMTHPKAKQIVCLGIAPACAIDPDICGGVMQYRAKASRDRIPRIDVVGWRQAEALGTVRTLESHPNAPWHDHSFSSPTYANVIRMHVNKFINTGRL